MKKYQIVFVALVILFLSLPLGGLIGMQDKIRIYGVENITEFASLQEKKYIDRQFQNNFEKWWQTHFFLRKLALLLKNQIYDWSNFGLIHLGGEATIIQGKDKFLYGSGYFTMFMESMPDFRPQLNKIVELDSLLKKKGISLYFIIAADKASTYRDFLPERYKYFLDDYCDYAQQMNDFLSGQNVKVFNGQKVADAMLHNEAIPPFNVGGLHWNLYGAGRVLYDAAEYFDWGKLEIVDVIQSLTPYYTERDLADLLNLIFKYKIDEMYYKPAFSCLNSKLHGQTAILGNSFSNEFAMMFYDSLLAGDNGIIHYANPPLFESDVEKILSSKQIIIVYTAVGLLHSNDHIFKKIDQILNAITVKNDF